MPVVAGQEAAHDEPKLGNGLSGFRQLGRSSLLFGIFFPLRWSRSAG
jgi:hypothetical protein